MENKQQMITLAFVLVVGLLGGYMIAQHVGHAADSHREMHEVEDHKMDDDRHMLPQPGDMPGPDADGGMQGGAGADVRVQ